MAEPQNDPLLPGYSFNAHLVAGLTPIEAEGYLDFYVDRPLGMKGYILNLTVRGEGVVKNGDQQFICRPGDMLLFPPGRSTTTGAIRMPKSGITSGSISVRAPTGRSGSRGRPFSPIPVYIARMRRIWRSSVSCSHRLLRQGRRAGATPNCWPSTCLNRCCCAAWRPSTSRLIRRWTTASATPASTSATTLPTASLILPASPSMCACRRHGSLICSASSLA